MTSLSLPGVGEGRDPRAGHLGSSPAWPPLWPRWEVDGRGCRSSGPASWGRATAPAWGSSGRPQTSPDLPTGPGTPHVTLVDAAGDLGDRTPLPLGTSGRTHMGRAGQPSFRPVAPTTYGAPALGLPHSSPSLAATSQAFLVLLSASKTTGDPGRPPQSPRPGPVCVPAYAAPGAYQSQREAYSLITIPRGDRAPTWRPRSPWNKPRQTLKKGEVALQNSNIPKGGGSTGFS